MTTTQGHDSHLPLVTVLMPVYNGAEFLEEQVRSILDQEGVSVRLVAIDDGSRDMSLELLRNLAKYDPRIAILVNYENIGLIGSIGRLLNKVDSSSTGYLAMSDQDDIWDRDKLSSSVAVLKKQGASLVYSDVRVIDATGSLLSNTYLAQRSIRPIEGSDPLPFVFRNPAIGHTIVAKAELAPLMASLPETLIYHESWLIGVACQSGEVAYIDRVLGSYRQHSNNVIGAKYGFFKRVLGLFRKSNSLCHRQYTRAAALDALKILHPNCACESLAELTSRHGFQRWLGLPSYAAHLLRLSREIGLAAALVEIVLYPIGVSKADRRS